MIQYTVIVEDKNGNEVRGTLESPKIITEEDQLLTVRNYKGTYTTGFLLEILGEKNGSLR
jgi:hypothetical protein